MSRINIPDSELWGWGSEKDKPEANRFEKGNESGPGVLAPKNTDHNFQMNRSDQNMQYVLRNAKLPWDAGETYEKGAIVYLADKEYKCLQKSTNNNPATSPTYWEWIDNNNLPVASTSKKGIVQLSSSTTSDSEALAATPKAVKTAKTAADNAQSTADKAMPAFVKSVTSDDWNDLVDPGGYSVVGSTGPNRPPAYTYGTLFVLATGSTVTQIYYTDQTNQQLSRTIWKSVGTWSAWEILGGTTNVPSSAKDLENANLNDLDGSSSYLYGAFGFFYQDATAEATTERNYPEKEPGTLIITKSAMSGGSGCVQTYITRSNNIYTRSKYVSWSEWVKMYSTKNKPTPTDINALTGVTVSQNIRDSGSWIKIADVNLPHSSSTAKISISGGAGFNAGSDYQSAEHRIIVRGGNVQGQANGTLYTDDERGCPFSAFGFVYTSNNRFDLYGRSKANYSLGCLFEYAASSGDIIPHNEVQSSEPTGLVLGNFVRMYTSEQLPPSTRVGQAIYSNGSEEGSANPDGFKPALWTNIKDIHNLMSYNSSTGEFSVITSGYYDIEMEVVRYRQSDGQSLQGGRLLINGTIKESVEGLSNNFSNSSIKARCHVKLDPGDRILYQTKGSTISKGGGCFVRYVIPS